jgi:hypothetical protein
MKRNKIALLSLAILMASFHANLIQSKDENEGEKLLGKAIGLAIIAPLAGLHLGYQRRTFQLREENVNKQSTSMQQEIFKKIYLDQKIDTKFYTSATGPLSLLTCAGIATRHPVGFAMAALATTGNVIALLSADAGQEYNQKNYDKALVDINIARSRDKEMPITGDDGLSTLQKILCIRK